MLTDEKLLDYRARKNHVVRLGLNAFKDGYWEVTGKTLVFAPASQKASRRQLDALLDDAAGKAEYGLTGDLTERVFARFIALSWLGGRSHAAAMALGETDCGQASRAAVELMCRQLSNYIGEEENGNENLEGPGPQDVGQYGGG